MDTHTETHTGKEREWDRERQMAKYNGSLGKVELSYYFLPATIMNIYYCVRQIQLFCFSSVGNCYFHNNMIPFIITLSEGIADHFNVFTILDWVLFV